MRRQRRGGGRERRLIFDAQGPRAPTNTACSHHCHPKLKFDLQPPTSTCDRPLLSTRLPCATTYLSCAVRTYSLVVLCCGSECSSSADCELSRTPRSSIPSAVTSPIAHETCVPLPCHYASGKSGSACPIFWSRHRSFSTLGRCEVAGLNWMPTPDVEQALVPVSSCPDPGPH